MTDRKVKVTVAAVRGRIKRSLAKDNQILRRNKGMRNKLLGEWYVIDLDTGLIARPYVDLATFAADLGCLEPWEEVEDE